MDFIQGKTGIVTGASSGLGRVIATRLAKEGMNIVLAARTLDKLLELKDQLESNSVRVEAVQTDVTEQTALESLVRFTKEEFGTIDLLVNNAGVEAFTSFEECSLEQIEQTVAVNVLGTLKLTRFVIPEMLHQQSGCIVNISSTSGKFGAPWGSVYAATKAALIGFSRSLHAEYYKRGIQVVCLCPGFTDEGGIYEEIKEKTGKKSPCLVGSTSAGRVASAVVKSLRSRTPEMIINWPPQRPVSVIQEMFPRLGSWLVRKASGRFLNQIAMAKQSLKKSNSE